MKTGSRLTGGILAFALAFAAVEYIPCFESAAVTASAEAIAPENVRATYERSKLTVSWDKLDEADAYKISYRYEGDKKYTNYKTVKNNICIINDPQTGKKLTILVTPLYKTASGYKSGKSSGISKVIEEKPAYTSSVKQLTYSALSFTSVTLEWRDALGADDYKIYRLSEGKRYELNASVKDTRNGKSAKIKGLKEGTNYTFAVIPVKLIDGAEEEGTEKQISITTPIKVKTDKKPEDTSSPANYIARDMPDPKAISAATNDEYFNYLRAAGFKIERNIHSDPYFSSYSYVIYDNGVVAGYFTSIKKYIDIIE